MKSKTIPLRCYIGTYFNENIDPMLAKFSFSKGLILFAIPDYGILFRCRADGRQFDLEFGAMLSALRFINKKLANEKIEAVQIISSMPELVYSFINRKENAIPDNNRERLLKEYTSKIDVSIAYIDLSNNPIYRSTSEFPSLPVGVKPPIKPGPADRRKGEFRNIQRGIRI